jgi:pimeloyl-ACP methyl ester carboxylesterase
MNHIHANGLEFAYLEEGEGPLVLLLHGFPDTAYSWSHQVPALAEAGYRTVAPYLRGYPPSEIPRDGFYDKGTLVADIAALIRALSGDAQAYLVGQDWGASITYNLLAAHPELVRRAVVMAVPHPAETAKSVLNARHVHRSFHWWFFQLPRLPETALAENDFAFVDYLWEYWASPGYRDTEHVAKIKRMLAEPGALPATLGYYRALFDPRNMDPRLETLRQSR